jgi:hypothetical protein
LRWFAVPFAAFALLIYGGGAVPYDWTHTLTPGCSWRERPAVGFLGRPRPRDEGARWHCLVGHGAHAPWPSPPIKVLLARFPTQAEVAAWNGEAR